MSDDMLLLISETGSVSVILISLNCILEEFIDEQIIESN